MRAVIQRVSQASVTIDGQISASIGRGVLIYLAVHEEDIPECSTWLAKKILSARIFENPPGKLSDSVVDVRGEILIVPQFTLYGSLLNGNRPDMTRSMKPPAAKNYFEEFVKELASMAQAVALPPVKSGQFGAHMFVESVNDGPVTILVDTRDRAIRSAAPA